MAKASFAILEGEKVIPVDDVLTWAKWFEENKRTIQTNKIGDTKVSTVFIGLDQSFSLDEEALWFETMIFGGPHDQEQWNYTTYKEAVAGHKKAIDLIMETK